MISLGKCCMFFLPISMRSNHFLPITAVLLSLSLVESLARHCFMYVVDVSTLLQPLVPPLVLALCPLCCVTAELCHLWQTLMSHSHFDPYTLCGREEGGGGGGGGGGRRIFSFLEDNFFFMLNLKKKKIEGVMRQLIRGSPCLTSMFYRFKKCG